MFRFSPHYPIDSPAVQFLVDSTHVAPIHPVRLSHSYLHTTKSCLRSSTYIRMAMYVRICYRLFDADRLAGVDMREHSWQRVVPRSKRNLGVCNTSEHVSILQGSSHIIAFHCLPLLTRSRSRRKSGAPSYSDACALPPLIRTIYRPPDNDRYVSTAPDNPKKVFYSPVPLIWTARANDVSTHADSVPL